MRIKSLSILIVLIFTPFFAFPNAAMASPASAVNASQWSKCKNLGEQAEIDHDYAKAEFWYGRALEEAEKNTNAKARLQETIVRYAISYVMLDKVDKAEPLYHQAMRNAFEGAGHNDPEMLVWLEDLADAYSSRGKGLNAETCLRHAIEIRQAISLEHSKLAGVLYDLADFYIKKSRWNEALPIAQRALTSYASTKSKVKVKPAQCWLLIAQAERGLHHYDKSSTASKTALTMINQVAPDSTYESCIKRMQGDLCSDQNKYSEAEDFYQEALKLDQKIDGKKGLYEFADYNALAEMYEKRHELVKAEQYYRKTINLFATRLDPDNAALASPSLRLAILLHKEKKHDEANKLENHARKLFKAATDN